MRPLNVFLGIVMLSLFSVQSCSSQKQPGNDIQLAVQAWSFRNFTFQEAVKQAAQIGFRHIEMFPGQKISEGTEGNTHFGMSEESRELVKSILKENNIKLVQYGVVSCNSKEEWVQLFEFCKAMGVETINSEPEFSDFILLDSLTQAFNINLAVHNHATGTRYWDPQIVLDQIEGKNPRIGVCADNGHWMRSGLDPVESLKKVEGKLITMHIKDMSEFNNLEAHTVAFGTGVLDGKKLIDELKRQGFSGIITVENEYNWDNPANDLTTTLASLNGLLK
ncbi:MAG: sugar phosphate isomerase/epimerase [Bacteroidales bacterium]|nr:sugar phosphate isomerase/epimerase [Bacteroidales bacterium]